MREIHQSPVDYSHKGSATGDLVFSNLNELLNKESIYRWFNTPLCSYDARPVLTHWGRLTHICISKLTIIGSDNDLSSGRRQVIILTNAGLLSIGTFRTNFSEILSEICAFSLNKLHLKMSSAKWRPLCFGLNVLTILKCQKANFQKTFERHSLARIFYCILGLRVLKHIFMCARIDRIPWIDDLVT